MSGVAATQQVTTTVIGWRGVGCCGCGHNVCVLSYCYVIVGVVFLILYQVILLGLCIELVLCYGLC